MRHTPHTKRLSMASVDNSIGGAAGDASSGQEPIDVEPGSSLSPMNNEVRHFVFLLSWVQQEHSVNPYCCAERALKGQMKGQTDQLYFCTSLAPGLTSAPSFTIAFSPQTGGCSEGLGAFRFFFKQVCLRCNTILYKVPRSLMA